MINPEAFGIMPAARAPGEEIKKKKERKGRRMKNGRRIYMWYA